MSDEKTAKQECEELMDSLLSFAKQMLTEYQEFHPFGGYMEPTGQTIWMGVEDPDAEFPPGQKMIETLENTFREMARKQECKAVAMVCDVRLTPPKKAKEDDAIRVSLDHVDEYSVHVFFPYSFVNNELVFGETFVTSGDQGIFRWVQ